jgi:hypothetical protein
MGDVVGTRGTVIVLILLALTCSATLPFKNLQGPPEEFNDHRLPNPSSATITSDSSLLAINLKKEEDGNIRWIGKIPIDSTKTVTMSLISPHVDKMTLEIISDHVTTQMIEETSSSFGMGENTFPAKSYMFKDVSIGTWEVKIELKGDWKESTEPNVFLLTSYDSPYRLSTHQLTYETIISRNIGVVAQLSHNDVGTPIPSETLSVELDVRLPDGTFEVIRMHDDGLHNDGAAHDGVYGASLQATEEGVYTTQVVLQAKDIFRTAQNTIAVVKDKMTLVDTSVIEMKANEEMVTVKLLAIAKDSSVIGSKFKVYSEVWAGTKPIAWVSGMSIAERISDNMVALPLKMSIKWIQRANVQTLSDKFVLRNAYVQDVEHSIPLSTISISNAIVKTPNMTLNQHSIQFDGTITESMLLGLRPTNLQKSNTNGSHKTLLVHGYCAGGPPFPSIDFTDTLVLEDFQKARTNDEFAEIIGKLGAQADSFSIVSHSQGGLASLHLATFYWSNQDLSTAERPLQSVGSPYRGSALAGTIASIGYVFGVKCGSVYELTRDGSALWLATIPMERRKYVWYATTVYPSWSYCNLLANAVLSWPNDGVTEFEFSNLDGAHNVGNKVNWCHSPNMHYPPQGTDKERNTLMDQFAKKKSKII